MLNFLKNRAGAAQMIGCVIATSAALLVPGLAFAADSVNVRFAWKTKGEYAPLFLALENGYFENQNLDVSMGEGAGAQAALASILQGQDDIFVGAGIFTITGIQKGIPAKIIAIYHPAAPVVLVSHPDNPVLVPADLMGKKIATTIGETGTAYLDTFCEMNDVDCGEINRIAMTSSARGPMFLQREVDVISAYTTNDLPLMRASTGVEFVTMDLAQYGLTVPGMTVLASDAELADRPDVVKRFMAALTDGYEAMIADPAAAAAAIAKHWVNPPQFEIIEEQIRESINVTPRIEGKPLGFVPADIISFSLGLISEYEEDVGEIRPVEDFYTNAFLPQE